MRRRAAVMRSAPRMSSSGHSVRSESANSDGGPVESGAHPLCLLADDADEAAARLVVHVGKRRDRLDRRAHAGERRARTLGQRLEQRIAAAARLDAARDVVEHQHEPGDPVGRASVVASAAAPSTGAICTRTSWPAGAVVTKLATGLRASWRMRSRMLSSAWMMRLRSKTAKIERPSPTRLCALPAVARPFERLAQQLHGPRVVEQDAPLDVAHDDALRELRHQRRETVAFLLDARVGLAHAPPRRPASAAHAPRRSD